MEAAESQRLEDLFAGMPPFYKVDPDRQMRETGLWLLMDAEPRQQVQIFWRRMRTAPSLVSHYRRLSSQLPRDERTVFWTTCWSARQARVPVAAQRLIKA